MVVAELWSVRLHETTVKAGAVPYECLEQRRHAPLRTNTIVLSLNHRNAAGTSSFIGTANHHW